MKTFNTRITHTGSGTVITVTDDPTHCGDLTLADVLAAETASAARSHCVLSRDGDVADYYGEPVAQEVSLLDTSMAEWLEKTQ